MGNVDITKLAAINSWYTTLAGRAVYRELSHVVRKVELNPAARHIIQSGCWPSLNLLQTHDDVCLTQWLLGDPSLERMSPRAFVADCDLLPLRDDSVDQHLLVHSLDLASEPFAILQECQRTLIGDGGLVLIGFNRYSWWGLQQFCKSRMVSDFWQAPLSIMRAKRLIARSGLVVESVATYNFRPLLKNWGRYHNLHLLDTIGQLCCPYLGGVYVIVARKQSMIRPTKLMAARGIIARKSLTGRLCPESMSSTMRKVED